MHALVENWKVLNCLAYIIPLNSRLWGAQIAAKRLLSIKHGKS